MYFRPHHEIYTTWNTSTNVWSINWPQLKLPWQEDAVKSHPQQVLLLLLSPHDPPQPHPLPHPDAGHHHLQRVEAPRWSLLLFKPDASDSQLEEEKLQLQPTDQATRSLRKASKPVTRREQDGRGNDGWSLSPKPPGWAPRAARGTTGCRGQTRTVTTCNATTRASTPTPWQSTSRRRRSRRDLWNFYLKLFLLFTTDNSILTNFTPYLYRTLLFWINIIEIKKM